jgi:hypothetical protein
MPILSPEQGIFWQARADFRNEAAGAARFAGHVRRHSHAIAEPDTCPASEQLTVAPADRNEPGHVTPVKALRGKVTRAMDRIGQAKLLRIIPFFPAVGVVMNTDRVRCSCEVDVMRQGEIANPEALAGICQSIGQLIS